MNQPKNKLLGLLGGPPAKTLAQFLQNHYDHKVKNKNCELCGHNGWTMMVGTNGPNDYLVLRSTLDVRNDHPGGWPAMGWACDSCHHIRFLAIQPLIQKWIDSGAAHG